MRQRSRPSPETGGVRPTLSEEPILSPADHPLPCPHDDTRALQVLHEQTRDHPPGGDAPRPVPALAGWRGPCAAQGAASLSLVRRVRDDASGAAAPGVAGHAGCRAESTAGKDAVRGQISLALVAAAKGCYIAASCRISCITSPAAPILSSDADISGPEIPSDRLTNDHAHSHRTGPDHRGARL